MISLVAPKRNEMIEHPKVFRASRMGCLNTAANRVFTARSCKMDYTYDPPQHDYEHARWPCVPEECEFSVIGAVNQRFQPVPQETFTINSGEINGVFHRHICDYDSVSGVFVWPNHDPIGELGGLNLYGYVRNDPVNAIDPLGLIDCAALKATLEYLFSNFQRDSNLQRQFLNGQYNALGNLFVYNEAVDAGTTVAGAGLAEGLNAARVALTSETVGQGTSLAVDVARSGSLTGPGISSATSYLTPGIGGAIGGPLAAHGLGDTAGYISGELGQNYTSEGVQAQLQATIDELNAELNQQLANIQNLMNEYNAACQCH